MPLIDLIALSADELAALVRDWGWPRYRARQVLRWLYQSRLTDIVAMTDLSHADRTKLAAEACIGSLTPSEVLTSEDGTRKFIFPLEDGTCIESVLIPDDDRLTLCLSTQVGCTLDCTFCLTGQMGLQRNLKAHEIVGQVLAAQRYLSHPSAPDAVAPTHPKPAEAGSLPVGRVPSRSEDQPITNLVLMGMGEPLANAAAVEEALRRLTNQTWGVGFSLRRITLSTAGLSSRLKQVANLGVNLAVSLNATTDEQRNRLMPSVNKAHPLETLLAACRAFPLKPRRRLTFEYVLLSGVNDSKEDAARLIKLVRGIRCKINLIPFNEFPGNPYRRPSDETVLCFQSILTRHGLEAYIRKSKGRDVLGACGQLGKLAINGPQALNVIRSTSSAVTMPNRTIHV